MRSCTFCKKKYKSGSGTLFRMPKDESKRTKWSEICGKNFTTTALLCADHFSPSSIIRAGNKVYLLPNAEPFIDECEDTENSDNVSEISISESNIVDTTKNTKSIPSQHQKGEFQHNILISSNNVVQMQEVPIKAISCAVSTQTNTRLCGSVQASDIGDEFRFNCFYCPEVFPLARWKKFINHLKRKHFRGEEAFKISKYVSEDHDYTPVSLPASTPSDDAPKTIVISAEALLPFLADPLESTKNPFESVFLNSSSYYTPYENKAASNNLDSAMPISRISKKSCRSKKEAATSSLPQCFKNVKNKSSTKRNSHKNATKSASKVLSSGVLYLRDLKRKTSKKTALSRCLKRTNIEIMEPSDKENVKMPTEIVFEYTPRDIVDLLLDNMKHYPVLWRFDEEPFNEEFYEAIENLCKIINDKWSLNIDHLKMRRSINRILRFFCYLFPNENVENIDQFTCYYDKCASFLPSSVNDVAYARCSHCYMCFRNDFDLKRHLLEEQKYLQWPYKCVQCKECFEESDEYEFHKRLRHYDEIFRCEPCKKTFVRRNIYNRHIVAHHPQDSSKPGKYVCNVCGKTFRTSSHLHGHKIYHGERKYKCHLCPKSFFVNAKLALHIKSHRKEYNVICEVCGKGFLLQKNLREHMKMHTGAKVTCSICNLKLRKSSLSRHLRTVHVAYEGTIETTFRAKNHHYNSLLRTRPSNSNHKRKCKNIIYQCKTCNISFENYKSIVEHNKEFHSDVPKWSCKMCSTEFSQKLNLKRHYRKKHNLHVFQVFKLVDQKEDLNEVLAIKTEQLDKLAETFEHSMSGSSNTKKTIIKNEMITSDPLPDEIDFDEEEVQNSTIHYEITRAEENDIIQEIKIDYINDFFTDL